MTAYFPTTASSPQHRGRSRHRHSASMSMPSPQFQTNQPYYLSPGSAPPMTAYSDSGHGAYPYPTTHQAPYGAPLVAPQQPSTFYVARSPSRHHRRRSESTNHHHHHSSHPHRSHPTSGHHHHSGHHTSHRHSSRARPSSTHHHHRSASAHNVLRRNTYTANAQRSRHPYGQLTVADRIRKFLGIGPWAQPKYVDREGRYVDRAGHPVMKF